MMCGDWTHILSQQIGSRLRRVVDAEALPITPTMAAKLRELARREEQLGAASARRRKGESQSISRVR